MGSNERLPPSTWGTDEVGCRPANRDDASGTSERRPRICHAERSVRASSRPASTSARRRVGRSRTRNIPNTRCECPSECRMSPKSIVSLARMIPRVLGPVRGTALQHPLNQNSWGRRAAIRIIKWFVRRSYGGGETRADASLLLFAPKRSQGAFRPLRGTLTALSPPFRPPASPSATSSIHLGSHTQSHPICLTKNL